MTESSESFDCADHGRVRRALDIGIALAGLVVFAVLMLLIALAIRCESAGPVIFAQQRIGQGGRRFRMHKFRKFHQEPGAYGALTLRDDPRMTRVGRILERSKLDELPQLYDVLVGSMALVGPRPEVLEFADCFNGAAQAVLRFRPGLFGPCQVLFRNESMLFSDQSDPDGYYRTVIFPAKVRVDLAYYSDRTIRSDLGWLTHGVLAVFGLGPALPDPLAATTIGRGLRPLRGPTLPLLASARRGRRHA